MNKCAGGVDLPAKGPCPECGAGAGEPCPRAIVRDREELERLRADLAMLKGQWEVESAENEQFRDALQAIAAMGGMTLIAPSLGPDCDRAHQLGANKAFGQAADIASGALAKASKGRGW